MPDQGLLRGSTIFRKWRGRTAIVLGISLLVAGAALMLAVHHLHRRAANTQPALTAVELASFTSLEPIDAHTHIFHSGPAFDRMLERTHMHVLDILFIDDTNTYRSPSESDRREARNFVDSNPSRATLCTTFDPFRFNETDFSGQAIAALNQDFARGAVAAKIWKNIGMELTDAQGRYVLPDDPRFEPIYRDIAAQRRTLIAHLAEPDVAWGPKDSASPYSAYYVRNPQWDMSTKPAAPPKSAILQAADHLLAMNPGLRVVAAHLENSEDRLGELAVRLDMYPNLAVDTAARVVSLATQPRDRVRAFILKYQDRILYGTDLNFYPDAADSERARLWESRYRLDWRYFSTDDRFEYQGHSVAGLNLPRSVLRKLYHDNAVRWFPGIDAHWH